MHDHDQIVCIRAGIFSDSSWGSLISLGLRTLMSYLVLSRKYAKESFDIFFSPVPDPDTDHLRGRPNHEPLHVTPSCVKQSSHWEQYFYSYMGRRKIIPKCTTFTPPSESEGNYLQRSHPKRMSHYKYTPSEIATELKS